MQPCVGRENKKREKVKIDIFREIKAPGNIPVIQYVVILTTIGSQLLKMYSLSLAPKYVVYQVVNMSLHYYHISKYVVILTIAMTILLTPG